MFMNIYIYMYMYIWYYLISQGTEIMIIFYKKCLNGFNMSVRYSN